MVLSVYCCVTESYISFCFSKTFILFSWEAPGRAHVQGLTRLLMCNNLLAVRSCGGQKAVAEGNWEPWPPPLLLSTEAPAPHSPVLHAGVAPDGLLHVSMALRYLAGPGPLPGLDRTLRDVVAVISLSAASSSTSTTSSTSSSSSCTPTTSNSAAASTGRWSGAEATKAVLAATLEVVLSAGERHLHPDPGVRCLSLWETKIQAVEGRLEVWPSNTVCKLLVLLNTVSWVVLLWEIQSACAEEVQTGQVRGVLRVLGRAGERPASNMTHTELPSALSPVCWCKSANRVFWVFTLAGCTRAALQKPSGGFVRSQQIDGVLIGDGEGFLTSVTAPTCMHGLLWLKLGGEALDSCLSSLLSWG